MSIPKNAISITVDEYNRQIDAWALPIGRFIAAFASCEYWTYLYVHTFGSERLRDAVGDMPLAPRAKIAQALVSDLGLVAAVQERVDAAFEKLAQLAGTRNLLAHNGPMAAIYRDEKTGEIVVRHEVRSARDPAKEITIQEIERRHAEAVALDEELALLYGAVRQAENRRK